MTDDNGASATGGSVTGGIRMLLRLEGLALAIACGAAYAFAGAPWWLFPVLFLAPDISFAAFLAGARAGTIAYDALHTTVGPLVLGAAGVIIGWQWPVLLALIWGAHIGIDRAVGYGLRYPARHERSHLGPVGRLARAGAGTG